MVNPMYMSDTVDEEQFQKGVNLRQVVGPEQLWETRGSSLPLHGVIGLWIGIGSLWNLDRPWLRFRARQLSSLLCVSRVATSASALFLPVQVRLSRRGGM